MFTRYPIRLAAAAALWMAQSQASPAQIGAVASPQPAKVQPSQEPARLSVVTGQEAAPAPNKATNQQMADRIAGAIRQSGRIRNFTIDINCQSGVTVLTGQVASAEQRQEVLQVVRAVPGVQQVVDRLAIPSHGEVVPAQAVTPEVGPPPALAPSPLAQPKSNQPPEIGPAPVPLAPLNTPPQEPTPIFQGPPGPHPTQPPPLPPYAWPTFAPYNNYSRVATPNLYPYQAWPFIGPMYPFPKIPLGWRSISLTWYDGHWWYGKKATGHDWWRVRYW